jgi:hypothetical protein
LIEKNVAVLWSGNTREYKEDVIMFFFFYDEESDTTIPVPVEDAAIREDDLEFISDEEIRKVWHSKEEEWYFSIVDVISVLTEQITHDGARKYWSVMKTRLKKEGAQLTTICSQLKMPALDGKFYRTDVATTEQLLRLIQSIPSKKAEPMKLWLAKVGSERIDETFDPEISVSRAVANYRTKGYSDKWITQRLRNIEVRKELTDEWRRSGVGDSEDFAKLTSILTRAWSGKTVQEYKQFKSLKKENLRDNMTNTELALNLLAEVSATELSKTKNPKGVKQSAVIAHEGGSIAGNARKELEEKLGHDVLSPLNASNPLLLDDSDKEK